MILHICFIVILIMILCTLIYLILLVSNKIYKTNNKFSVSLFSNEEMELISGNLDFSHNEITKKAIVLCSSERKFENKRFTYTGQKDCSLFNSVYSTEYDCESGCSGFGNCIKSCTRNAIEIINHTAVINNSCNGCGLCLTNCPKELIILIPKNTNSCIKCKATEKDINSCSMYRKESETTTKVKKDFQFWEKCYKIINRK